MGSVGVVHRPLAAWVDSQVHCRGVHLQGPQQPLLPLLGLPLLGELLSFLDSEVPLLLRQREGAGQAVAGACTWRIRGGSNIHDYCDCCV